ncbi:hypothetical protein DIS24_g35 [Lasiodiplodia hormozganensis]|uniref:Uncharacterized protein n=1 Tax=Lasiodiplodia hormozganensis TaxID=869390 RepID=A0AA40D6S6_9PEZI|nr:hypothetical protein DIS24_g35 [Lasiodiplodia hormozganensis]
MYKIPGAGRQDGLEVDVELVEATLELVDIEGVAEGVIDDVVEDPAEEDPVEEGPVEEGPLETVVLQDEELDVEDMLLLEPEALKPVEEDELGLVKEELLDEAVLKVPEGVVAVV